MALRPDELEFLSAWAREERAPNPYVLPAHQLQAAHGVKGVTLIRLIKAWARSMGRRDEDIFDLSDSPNPRWPWPDAVEPSQVQDVGLLKPSPFCFAVSESILVVGSQGGPTVVENHGFAVVGVCLLKLLVHIGRIAPDDDGASNEGRGVIRLLGRI